MAALITLFRNAFGGLPTTVWLLSLTQLINRSGTMVVFFLAVYLKDELHFSLSQVGLVMALFGAGTLVGVFFGGRLIDKVGYYPVMVFSLIFGGSLFIAVGFIRDYYLLCIAMFVLSAMGEAFRPANMAAMSFYSTPETYTRSITLNRLAINLGFSIGPALGGFLASVSYQWIFWADGISSLGAVVILLLFVKKKNTESAHPKVQADGSALLSPYKDKWFLIFLPMASLYAIAFFQFFSTMPLYYKDVAHLSEIQIGWLMALNGLLVAVFEMLIIYKYEKRWSLYNFIALGAFLLIPSYLSLLFFGGYAWLFVLTVVISFSEMFAMPFMNTFMNNRAQQGKRGQYASLYIMAWSSSQILTPIIATQIIGSGGYDMLWIVLAGFAAVCMVAVLWLKSKVAQ
jgi:predicted MFS family arabinose efflux permease